MLEMIGVGPFITLPLVIMAAGFRLSVWAWILGAAIAVADGLVWAELGAMFPRAGGSYAFLREDLRAGQGPGQLAELPLRMATEVYQHRCRLPRAASGWRAFWGCSGRGFPVRRLRRCLLCIFLCSRSWRACWSRGCSTGGLAIVTGMAWVLFFGRDGRDCGCDRCQALRTPLPSGGWHMPVAPALSAVTFRPEGHHERVGSGNVAGNLLLLGLLQHLLSGQRGKAG